MTDNGFTRAELQHEQSSALAKAQPLDDRVNLALIQGDLSRLSQNERRDYYLATCRSLGLNPLTKPFEYLRLNGREILYARKDCTDQLRTIHKVSLSLPEKRVEDGVYIVTSRATMPDGRFDESTGAVTIDGLKGEARANAIMKAETKAKRRVTLSICGLGLTDESEVADIPGAVVVPDTPEPAHDPQTGEVEETPAMRQAIGTIGAASGPFTQHARREAQMRACASLEQLREIGVEIAADVKAALLTIPQAGLLRDFAKKRKAEIVAKGKTEPAPPPVTDQDAPPPDDWQPDGLEGA
jgi:hypothetical protein